MGQKGKLLDPQDQDILQGDRTGSRMVWRPWRAESGKEIEV